MDLQSELKNLLLNAGASDVGFCRIEGADFGACQYAVSVVVRLSGAIVSEISDKPTHTYFNHYRSVNAFIDRLLLEAGLFLQKNGYNYITVAASQSINTDENENYSGRFSHKHAARLAGLGSIGRNSLFIHSEYGSAVRLGTVFTDAPLFAEHPLCDSPCTGCNKCVDACPAHAISGADWFEGADRALLFNPEACSTHMKSAYKSIGRGAVCGICMRVCPFSGI